MGVKTAKEKIATIGKDYADAIEPQQLSDVVSDLRNVKQQQWTAVGHEIDACSVLMSLISDSEAFFVKLALLTSTSQHVEYVRRILKARLGTEVSNHVRCGQKRQKVMDRIMCCASDSSTKAKKLAQKQDAAPLLSRHNSSVRSKQPRPVSLLFRDTPLPEPAPSENGTLPKPPPKPPRGLSKSQMGKSETNSDGKERRSLSPVSAVTSPSSKSSGIPGSPGALARPRILYSPQQLAKQHLVVRTDSSSAGSDSEKESLIKPNIASSVLLTVSKYRSGGDEETTVLIPPPGISSQKPGSLIVSRPASQEATIAEAVKRGSVENPPQTTTEPAEPSKLSSPCIGIDFGTAGIRCAVVTPNRKVSVLHDDLQKTSSPNCLMFVEEDESETPIIYGAMAVSKAKRHPSRCIRDVRLLYRNGRINADGMPTVETKYWDGSTVERSVVELGALLLRKTKSQAEAQLGGQTIRSAVISVPVDFNPTELALLKESAKLAQFEQIVLKSDTILGALTFIRSSETFTDGHLLAISFGRANFEVSVVEVWAGEVTVLSAMGSLEIGGSEFDKRIVDMCIEKLLNDHGVDIQENRKATARLETACEAAKCLLTGTKQTVVKFEYDDEDYNLPVDRQTFEDKCADLFERVTTLIEQAIVKSAVGHAKIRHAVLLGGCSRMPKVHEIVRKILPIGAVLHHSVGHDEAIAEGAAILAGFLQDLIPDGIEKLVFSENDGVKKQVDQSEITEKSLQLLGREISSHFAEIEEEETRRRSTVKRRTSLERYANEQLRKRKQPHDSEFSERLLSKVQRSEVTTKTEIDQLITDYNNDPS